MARLIVAALLVLLGAVLISAGFQEYVDGSCGAGECVFNRRLDDPIFVIFGALAIASGVLLFLNRLPLWKQRRELPPPANPTARKYQPPPSDRGPHAGLLFLALQDSVMTNAKTDGGPWLTALFIAIVLAAIGGGVWFARHRGPGEWRFHTPRYGLSGHTARCEPARWCRRSSL